MGKFKHKFLKLLDEDMSADGVGMGSDAQSTFSGDTYAPGDARFPFFMGMTRRPMKRRKKRAKSHKRRKS